MLSRLLQLDTHLLTWITSHRISTFNTPLRLISVIGRGGLVWWAIASALAVGRRIRFADFSNSLWRS